jgi:3-deoxy-D-manno-octulosonic-acid transferase
LLAFLPFRAEFAFPDLPAIVTGLNLLASRRFRIALVLYDTLWALAIGSWLIFRLLSRPRDARSLKEAMGFLPFRPKSASAAVWFHAVSIGEVLSTRPVFAALKRQHPDWWVLLTTTHPQAFALASAQPSGADAVCRLPWDFGPCVETALKRARPDLVVLVECELWPNLVFRSARRGISLLMMNARVYERDLPRYLLGRFLFTPILQLISLIGAQSEGDRGRFLRLGAPQERTVLVGNTKFDVGLPADLPTRLTELRAVLPLRGPLWVLASTHDNEEETILSRCQPLRDQFPGLQFLIAPRHSTRANGIKKMAEKLGFRTSLRSLLPSAAGEPSSDPMQPDVILLDTVGELPVALGLADLVFIGGSLVDRGGHNPIEAGLYAKAILMGPSVYNFQEVVAAFRSGQGVVLVRDAEELIAQAIDLLSDSARREVLGRNAAEVVSRHVGAAEAYLRQMTKLVCQPNPALLRARAAA